MRVNAVQVKVNAICMVFAAASVRRKEDTTQSMNESAGGSSVAESGKILSSSTEQPQSLTKGSEELIGVIDHDAVTPVETLAHEDEHGESTGSNVVEEHTEDGVTEQNALGESEGM